MGTEELGLAVKMAKQAGMTPREALIHWELAGGISAGDASMHWALIAIDLAMADMAAGYSRGAVAQS